MNLLSLTARASRSLLSRLVFYSILVTWYFTVVTSTPMASAILS